ncbi:hypothetical protein [Planomicrobium sp. CPCC 101110]|uniref:hypothetical protein n=1 Tax=Planomicrobium sp. CPCC 101110 TaxID=2599619 RepID=UPI0011B79F47|nr:hypothetical protein [Planomicrobium sp. CPCC 101110]TWT28379.1 hypothetical protein FQV30_07715 [Planomicrobium sp. CPCC 101110]
MESDIYSIELLHQGKYESWEFKDESERDELFNKVKKRYAGKEIQDKNHADDRNIVQLSATSLHIKAGNDVSQTVPFEWYDYDVFGEMLSYINSQYTKQNKSIS